MRTICNQLLELRKWTEEQTERGKGSEEMLLPQMWNAEVSVPHFSDRLMYEF